MDDGNRKFTGQVKLASGLALDEGNGPTVLTPWRLPVSWIIAGMISPFGIVAMLVAIGRVSLSQASGRNAAMIASVCAAFVAWASWSANRRERQLGDLLVIDHVSKRVRLPRHGVEFPFISVEAVHLLEGMCRDEEETLQPHVEVSLLIRDRDGELVRWPLFTKVAQIVREPTYELVRRLGDELHVSIRSDVADEPNR